MVKEAWGTSGAAEANTRERPPPKVSGKPRVRTSSHSRSNQPNLRPYKLIGGDYRYDVSSYRPSRSPKPSDKVSSSVMYVFYVCFLRQSCVLIFFGQV